MDKPRGLLVQTIPKWLVLLLGLGLFLGLGPRSFAWNDELGVLNQQESKLFQQGKYQQAIPVAEKLLSMARRELGPEDPDTVMILYNLAVLYDEMGDYAKAEPLYQQALQIRKKTRGPAHPDTADSLEGLGVLYVTMGDYARAEPLLEQALQIKRKALGPKHLGTATSLNHLADLYEKMGDSARAEPLFEQALKIRNALRSCLRMLRRAFAPSGGSWRF
jgi:tetratricopeptide (TPR) repeat protein